MPRGLARGLSFGFLALIAIVPIVDLVAPVKYPDAVRREGDAEPTFAEGSLAREFERRLRRRSRVRSLVVPQYAAFLFERLEEVHPTLVVGHDSWVFLRQRLRPDPRWSADHRQRLAARVGRFSLALKARGIRLIVIPIPRKGCVHREQLPEGFDPQVGLLPEFLGRLRHEGVEAIDLVRPFGEARARGEALYHALDTHWNDHAMVLAARAVAEQSGLAPPPGGRYLDLRPTEMARGHSGLKLMMGMDRDGDLADTLVKDRYQTYRLFTASGARLGRLDSPVEMTRIAIVGTSFTHDAFFADYLAHFLGEPIRNESLVGAGPVVPFDRLLSSGMLRPGRPEIILWEIPADELFCSRDPLQDLDRLRP